MENEYLDYVSLKDIRSYLDGGSIEIVLVDRRSNGNHYFVIDHRLQIGTGKLYAGSIKTFDKPGSRLATEYEIEAINDALYVVFVTCKEALEDINKLKNEPNS